MSDLPAEVATWLAHPQTARWLEWLNEKADFYRKELPLLVANGRNDQARTAAGSVLAYEEILLGLVMPAEVKPMPDMPFVDPAMRLSLRKVAK